MRAGKAGDRDARLGLRTWSARNFSDVDEARIWTEKEGQLPKERGGNEDDGLSGWGSSVGAEGIPRGGNVAVAG